jgi:predicted nucleic acid-binding protein
VAGLALDTSVIVASLQSWHVHYPVTSAFLAEALTSDDEIIIPLSALIESYSVMTRLPVPRRLPPSTALDLLESTFAERTRIVALEARDGWPLLRDRVAAGVVGGGIYDALILDAAIAAGADRIATLNARDFERLRRPGITVVSPLGAAPPR